MSIHPRVEAIDEPVQDQAFVAGDRALVPLLAKVLDFDITDFELTVSRYDKLCKRKPADAVLDN